MKMHKNLLLICVNISKKKTKLTGYIYERDAHPGRDFFDEVKFAYINQPKCIFVIVSKDFLLNDPRKDKKLKFISNRTAYENLGTDNVIPIVFCGAEDSVPDALVCRVPQKLKSNQWDGVENTVKEKLLKIVEEFWYTGDGGRGIANGP